MIGIIIYLTGYIVAWVLLRYTAREIQEEEYGWSDVAGVWSLSLFSWIAVLIGIGMLFSIKDIKPPKWL